MRTSILHLVTTALLLALAACAREPEPHATELGDFRATLAAAPDTLAGGSASADALVERWARALRMVDTAELRRMAVTRAEFAYLVYPSSPIARPPYDLPPALMWMQLESNSGKGLRDVLRKRGGEPLALIRFQCDAPERQGRNRVHGGCRVLRRTAAGETVAEQLFGAILERDGRFKFLSYASRL